MRRRRASHSKLLGILLLLLILVGCQPHIPKGLLRPSAQAVQSRQLQSRRYDTSKEDQIVIASAGVLQDLEFNLDESEPKLGVVVASKESDASTTGQYAMATLATILGGLAGSATSNAFDDIDDVQRIQASVVTQPVESNKVIVRVTFQRIIWNKKGNISRMETLNEPELYQGFFEKLSKAIFLEAHKI